MAHPGIEEHHEHLFDDHSSLAASLEDYEDHTSPAPMFNLPSQHSGFRSEQEESDIDEQSNDSAPWSPPGFRKHQSAASGSGWFRHEPYVPSDQFDLRPSNSPSGSRQSSPEYADAIEGDPDLTIPANIPLPPGTDSPLKGRSPSPAPSPDGIEEIVADRRDEADTTSNCSPPSGQVWPCMLTELQTYDLRCAQKFNMPSLSQLSSTSLVGNSII